MPNPSNTTPGQGRASGDELDDELRSAAFDDRAGDRMARLEGDRVLLDALQVDGYCGKNWDYFESVLATYGLAVVRAWLRDRSIFEQCARKGFGGLLPPPDRSSFNDPDTVLELAGETVAVALESFRRTVLVPGKWDHRRGASLRTYFIGHCLLKFPNIYRQWRQTEVRAGEILIPDHSVLEDFVEFLEGPEGTVADRDLVSRLLGAVPNEEARKAFVMTALGLTQNEIATRLHTTSKAVERMLDRARQQARKAA